MNIYLLDSKSFKLEDTILPRKYEVKIKDIVILRNVESGDLIYLDVMSNILIDGIAATYALLRQTVYNFSCACGTDDGQPKFKIFDYTFDYTFE